MKNIIKKPKIGKRRDGKESYPDVKRLVMGDNIKSIYEQFLENGMTPDEALSSAKRHYDVFVKSDPNNKYESFYAGQLPEVVVKPDYNKKYLVDLITHYPSKLWPIGHSELVTPGGNCISAGFDDDAYNLVLNNCSDATISALSQAFGTNQGWHLINTPGSAKEFAEKRLGGISYVEPDDDPYYNNSTNTYIPATISQLQTLANFARKLSRTGQYADGKPSYNIQLNDDSMHNFHFDGEGNTVLDNGTVGTLTLPEVSIRPNLDVINAINRRINRLASHTERTNYYNDAMKNPISGDVFYPHAGGLEPVYPEFDAITLGQVVNPLIKPLFNKAASNISSKLNSVFTKNVQKPTSFDLDKFIKDLQKTAENTKLSMPSLKQPAKTTTGRSKEEIAKYLEENPYRLERRPASGDIIEDDFPKNPFSLAYGQQPQIVTPADIAKYDMDVADFVAAHPEAYANDVFGGMPPLSNFLARNNLTLKDALNYRISDEEFIDYILMNSGNSSGYFDALHAGMQEAYQKVTGDYRKLLGPDEVNEIVYRMSQNDPEALQIRKLMIENGGWDSYVPQLRKIHIKQPPTINIAGTPQITANEQIGFQHELGHLLNDVGNTRQAVKDELERLLGMPISQAKKINNGQLLNDITGLNPHRLKDKGEWGYLIDDFFDEIIQRVGQWKDALGFRNASQQLTGDDVRKMMKKYILETGEDNNMSSMIRAIEDPDKFAAFFSKFAKNIAIPTAVGTTALESADGFKNGKAPGIHIKPENRGKFTALKKRTGHSTSWFKKNGTPAQKKMATFAQNAKKWNHKKS